MKKPRIFTPDNPLRLGYTEGQATVAKFNNTRMVIFENVDQPKFKGPCNLLEMRKLQDDKTEVFCKTFHLERTLGGKSISISHVALTDEALEALYHMLRVRFEDVQTRPRRKVSVFTDDDLKKRIRNDIQKGLNNETLAAVLNQWGLPWEQYMMAVDYYKELEAAGNK